MACLIVVAGNIALQVVHFGLLLMVIIVGYTKANTGNWTPLFPFGAKSVATGAGQVFFVFIGETFAAFSFFDWVLVPRCVTRRRFRLISCHDLLNHAVAVQSDPLVCVGAWTGYDAIALGAEEAKTPRSVPVGMLGSIGVVMVVYMLMVSVLVMLIPFPVLAAQPGGPDQTT